MVVTDIDQLWVADITYIRLQEEFVFLAVILDAYSRRVIGWALERTLEDDLTLAALRMALSQRAIQPGLVHHSDRGSQYASTDYTDLLKAHGIDISMSRKGNPWDNAACESFMKSLKYEEVLRNEYRDLGEARRSIVRFLEQVYNEKRLHSALGYRPPAEFEQALLAQKRAGAECCSSLFEHAGGSKGARYRETLQATGFYVGRVVIATTEFAPMPPLSPDHSGV
jgi:putative transposase